MCVSAVIAILDRTRVSYTSGYAADALSSGLCARWPGDSFSLWTVWTDLFPAEPCGWRTGVDMLPSSGRVLEPQYRFRAFVSLRRWSCESEKKIRVSSFVVNDAIFVRSLFVYDELTLCFRVRRSWMPHFHLHKSGRGCATKLDTRRKFFVSCRGKWIV